MSRYPKNIDQDAVRAEMAAGVDPATIAQRLGMSPATLGLRLTFGNLPVKQVQYAKRFDADKAIAMRESGSTIKDIAEATGYSTCYVFKVLKAHGVQKPAELTVDKRDRHTATARADAFWERMLAGATLQDIADGHMITRERVRQILKRAGHTDIGEVARMRTENDYTKRYPVGMEFGYRVVTGAPERNKSGHVYVPLKCCRCGRVIRLTSEKKIRARADCICSSSPRSRLPKGVEIGSRFGSWTVIGNTIHIGKSSSKMRAIPCRCDCGTERNVFANVLIAGQSKSCGCQRGALQRASRKTNRAMPQA